MRLATWAHAVHAHPKRDYTATNHCRSNQLHGCLHASGLCSITLTNASEYAIAQPSMAGRTSKLLADGAWDGLLRH